MKCKRCGRDNPGNVARCMYCNTPLYNNAPHRRPLRNAHNNNNGNNNNGDNAILVVIIVLVVILAMLVGVYAVSNIRPRRRGFSGGGGGGGGAYIGTNATYTVSFDLNYDGAPQPPEPQNVKSGDKIQMPDIPERTNYAFVAWYRDKEFSTLFNPYNDVVKSNMVLYARWLDVSNMTDSDGDGLIDELEKFFGCDPNVDDTDNDGLSDYIEVAVLGLKPTQVDSDGDGVKDPGEDTDGDGLQNITEISLGTNPATPYTDGDTLTDSEEVNKYKTDPLKNDTDNDGVNDDKEIELGTDPLVAQSVFSIDYTADVGVCDVKASVKIDLKGNQVGSLSVKTSEKAKLFPMSMPGYIGEAYDFKVDGSFGKAEISFEFDKSLLSKPGFDPVIYYFNEAEQRLEALATTIVDNVATAIVKHFSTYVLLDRSVYEAAFTWEDYWVSNNYTGLDLVLVVDDSGSMERNDSNNERLEVAKKLVDGLPEETKIGIVGFDSSVEKLTDTLIEDKDKIKEYLSTTNFESSGDTYMYTAISDAMSLFDNKDKERLRMLVVLSDGQANDSSMHQQVINKAKAEDVKVYTIGLGNDTGYFERFLKPLAVNTKGVFYLASNAEELSEIYKDIGKKIDIETDTDKDDIPDYYEINLVMFNGTRYIMDKNNPDTDGDGLLDGEEVELVYEYNKDKTKVKVTGKIKSDPTRTHSDQDVYNDYFEVKELKTDPMRKNVILQDGHVGYLTNSGKYFADMYKKYYEENWEVCVSVWIANNIYGDNHDIVSIYKDLLVEYFKQDESHNAENEKNKVAEELGRDIVDCLKVVFGKAVDDVVKLEVRADISDKLLEIQKQIDIVDKNILDLGAQTGDASEEILKQINKANAEMLDLMNKESVLQDALEKAESALKGNKGLKIKSNVLDTNLNISSIGFEIFSCAGPAVEEFKAYNDFKGCVSSIKDQMNVLDAIIKDGNNLWLETAARDLKISSENQFLAQTLFFKDFVMGIAAGKIKDAILDFIPGKFWGELALQVIDTVLPVSASGKEALETYAVAKAACAVSTDLVNYLSSGKTKDGSGMYVMYDDKSSESIKRFKSLAEMRIYGEEQMIELQSVGADWFKEMRRLMGSEYETILSGCNDRINTINTFKNIYDFQN